MDGYHIAAIVNHGDDTYCRPDVPGMTVTLTATLLIVKELTHWPLSQRGVEYQ
jgi:hypothetical protein